MANSSRSAHSINPARIILLLMFTSTTHGSLVFQPSSIIATGPNVTAYLLGDTWNISLSLRKVTASDWRKGEDTVRRNQCALPPRSSSNISESSDEPTWVPEPTQWQLTTAQMGKTGLQVQLRLKRNLQLCVDNNTEADCCPKPLCVLEALQVSACAGNETLASLFIQARVYALLFPNSSASAPVENQTGIPNQVYQPLGPCPCDLTPTECDIRCCCDEDCSPEDLKLFQSHCFEGVFGGNVSPPPDYQCSEQAKHNFPDWFPFLCVTSPPENNPYLGLFYQGDTVPAQPGPSFQGPVVPEPMPVNVYMQGTPILTLSDKYFTIPQSSLLGQCLDYAPVAFLENFIVKCVTLLESCPTGYPLLTVPKDLMSKVNNGRGGVVTVDVIDKVTSDLRQFNESIRPVNSSGANSVCENITLALDYKLRWQGNGITAITVTRTLGTVTLSGAVAVTTQYSAEFISGDGTGEPNSGNPGYQVGRPVIGGTVNTENDTDLIKRTTINLWNPVGDGLCSSAEKRPILYSQNATAGCLLPVSWQNMSSCDNLREAVAALQAALTTASLVAKMGNPDSLNEADWININFTAPDSGESMENISGSCSGIPSHQHVHVLSFVRGMADGTPQEEIRALQIWNNVTTWKLDCGGEDFSVCVNQEGARMFPVTSSVTFTDVRINTGPPKTRFQINFTEYDCDRNDVCWPELAFPLTRYYTGESYSLSLAKGLILVSFFIAASVLGTPWRQIRQAWSNVSL